MLVSRAVQEEAGMECVAFRVVVEVDDCMAVAPELVLFPCVFRFFDCDPFSAFKEKLDVPGICSREFVAGPGVDLLFVVPLVARRP